MVFGQEQIVVGLMVALTLADMFVDIDAFAQSAGYAVAGLALVDGDLERARVFDDLDIAMANCRRWRRRDRSTARAAAFRL